MIYNYGHRLRDIKGRLILGKRYSPYLDSEITLPRIEQYINEEPLTIPICFEDLFLIKNYDQC